MKEISLPAPYWLSVALLIVSALSWTAPARAALSPEAYSKALADFRNDTDTNLELKFIRSARKTSDLGTCRHRKCDCTDTYEAIEVTATPASHPVRAGDTLYFSYSCAPYLESVFPWSSVQKNGTELLAVPSRFILRGKDGSWHLTGPFRPSRPFIRTPRQAAVVDSPAVVEGWCRRPNARMRIDISDRYGRSLAQSVTQCLKHPTDNGGTFLKSMDIAAAGQVSGRITVSELARDGKHSGFGDNRTVFFRDGLLNQSAEILKLLSKENISLLREHASQNMETAVHEDGQLFHGSDLTRSSLQPLTEWAKKYFDGQLILPNEFGIIEDRHGDDFVTLELEHEGKFFYISWNIGANRITKVIASDRRISLD